MGLWRGLKKFLGGKSESTDPMDKVEDNILATPESRAAAREIVRDGISKMEKAIASSDRVVAGYDEILRKSSEYDKKFAGLANKQILFWVNSNVELIRHTRAMIVGHLILIQKNPGRNSEISRWKGRIEAYRKAIKMALESSATLEKALETLPKDWEQSSKLEKIGSDQSTMARKLLPEGRWEGKPHLTNFLILETAPFNQRETLLKMSSELDDHRNPKAKEIRQDLDQAIEKLLTQWEEAGEGVIL
jgi:hypothetical protein